jgi:hypothetical protein
MNGNLEPEERVMNEDHWLHDFYDALQKLGWEAKDNIQVDIGGTVVSGIHQGENYNEKWATPYGVRKYNKDAFIVIKNLTRSPFEPSKPFEGEFKQAHPYEKK